MAVNADQLRKDIQGGTRFLEAIDRLFPGKIDAELIQALKGAEDHPLLLDLIAKALTSAK